jgi:Cu(I)/Ag(I) efflux system membrane fusion protein
VAARDAHSSAPCAPAGPLRRVASSAGFGLAASLGLLLALVAVALAAYWAGGRGIGATALPAALAPRAAPAGSADRLAVHAGVQAAGERQILYYRNPMGLPDTSPVPKKDSMGMDYLPVYADEANDEAGVVKVSPARVQTLGVRTATVTRGALDVVLRASGRVAIDERAQVVVAPRFEGWIERLYVSAVGDVVRRGQPLLSAWSPALQAAGDEVRIAERLLKDSAADAEARAGAARLAEAARARLANLQVAGQTAPRQTLHAPADGIVLERMATQGARFMAGEPLFRIADLSRVWVMADLFERDLGRVQVGDAVTVSVEAVAGRRFEARIGYIYPTLDPGTRSTAVRIELDNREGLLRPGMFATVDLAPGAARERLLLPASALIEDGERQVVLRALGEGRFQPQPVRVGERGREQVEVLEGVAEGDRVVVSANFLIDSESQLRAALAGLSDVPQEAPSYETTGVFEEVFDDGVSLSHGPIPELGWPEMTMDFGLADRALVDGLQPGTPIRFSFEARGPGEYVVTRLERSAKGPESVEDAAPKAAPEPAHDHAGH